MKIKNYNVLNRFYVGCDRCQDWFHGKCVGISQKEADTMDVYLCPKCQQQDKEDPLTSKVLTNADYEHLKRLVKSLQVKILPQLNMNI